MPPCLLYHHLYKCIGQHFLFNLAQHSFEINFLFIHTGNLNFGYCVKKFLQAGWLFERRIKDGVNCRII